MIIQLNPPMTFRQQANLAVEQAQAEVRHWEKLRRQAVADNERFIVVARYWNLRSDAEEKLEAAIRRQQGLESS